MKSTLSLAAALVIAGASLSAGPVVPYQVLAKLPNAIVAADPRRCGAYTYGPFVMAVDRALNPEAQPLPSIRVLTEQPLKRVSADPVKFTGTISAQWANDSREMFFIPLADAGATNEEIRV